MDPLVICSFISSPKKLVEPYVSGGKTADDRPIDATRSPMDTSARSSSRLSCFGSDILFARL